MVIKFETNLEDMVDFLGYMHLNFILNAHIVQDILVIMRHKHHNLIENLNQMMLGVMHMAYHKGIYVLDFGDRGLIYIWEDLKTCELMKLSRKQIINIGIYRLDQKIEIAKREMTWAKLICDICMANVGVKND